MADIEKIRSEKERWLNKPEQKAKPRPVSFTTISGYHIREAGSTAAQEPAFTLADGFAYVEACLKRGLAIDVLKPVYGVYEEPAVF